MNYVKKERYQILKSAKLCVFEGINNNNDA